jgi:S-DNA-T family DNA segregation ATPase FtsK/SpoIIIE
MKKGKEETKKKSSSGTDKPKSFFTDERIKFVGGILVMGFAVYLLFAFIAYLFWWKTDQSLDPSMVVSGADVQVRNWSGKSGAWFAYIIVNKGFGLGSFFIPLIIASVGLYMLNFPKIGVWKLILRFSLAAIIISLCLGFVFGQAGGFLGSGPGGAHGYLVTRWLNAFMGKPGTGILLIFISISYLVYALNVSPSAFGLKVPSFLKKENRKR